MSASVSSIGVFSFPWPEATRTSPSRRGWPLRLRLVQVAVDTLVISIAVGVTYAWLIPPGQRLEGPLHISYAAVTPLIAFAWVWSLELAGSRDYRLAGAGLVEYSRVIYASLTMFGVLAIVSYTLQASFSRSLFVTTFPIGVALLLLGRWAARQRLNSLRLRGRALSSTLVVGTHAQVAELVGDMGRRADVGYRAAGVCLLDEDPGTSSELLSLAHHPADQVSRFATSGRYDAVIVADGLGREQIRDLAWHLEARPIELMFLPSLIDVAGPRMHIGEVEGLPLVHVELPRFTRGKLALKRGFDLAFAVAALLLLSPVFFVIAVLIKFDDGGPVFFRQERIGLRGAIFTIHKFRTMGVDAESKIEALIKANGGRALLFKMEHDPRITRIGQFLRKYSLDELPQFWSVLRGGMSVVGPRPQVAREVAEYTQKHHRRLLIKPGITGLWQVNGRSQLSLAESIRLDLRYVENWSLVNDVVIILKTIGVVVRPRGAF